MLPGDRLKGWVDSLATAWKERLQGWMASWVLKGVETTFDAIEPELKAEITTSLNRLKAIEGLPPDIKDILDKATAATSFIQLAAILPYLIGMMIGLGMGAAAPVSRIGAYQIDKLVKSARLDPASVITAWRRDKTANERHFQDLKDLGWNDDRIETLKFITLFIPSAAEQTLWLAREVFEPAMVTKYGLLDELPNYEDTDFEKIGVSPDQMKNIWAAHWEHASFQQMVEMLHRGLITEADFREWFKLVEIVPFWRDKLIQTVYTWPTRVDVRRWWDMRTIDEAELRRLYSGMGYRGDNLENYLLWTKVFVAFPDLLARWKNGWITLDDVRAELTGLGMPEDRVEEMIQTKIKPEGTERVSGERDLTKTDIIKGVKKGVITFSEGIELLMDLGYDEDEADYILTINIEALEGSPENMQEFKAITQKYRKAVGQPSKPVTEELIKAAAELAKATAEVEVLREAVKAEEKTLIDSEVLPGEASAKRDELRVALHRAEAELARVQTDYNALLAEWRQKEER